MEDKENKLLSVFCAVWIIAITGAIVCGILECFSVSTGVIGVIFGIITIIPLPIIFIWFICKAIIKKI